MDWNCLKSANSDEFVNVFPNNFLIGSLTKTTSKNPVLWLKIMFSDLTSAITQHSPVIKWKVN